LRDSGQQANQGKSVKSFDQHMPGDLAFFKDHDEKITHVGILLGADKIIHASGRVRVDHVNEEGILNLDSKIYTHTFSHIRRILPEA
jgi:cell wall-associated NlpC family hydrolase